MSHTTLEEVFLNLAHAGASAAVAIGAAPARSLGAPVPVSSTAVEMIPITAVASSGGDRRVSPGAAGFVGVPTAPALDAPENDAADVRAVNLRDLDETTPRSRAVREGHQFRAMFRKTFANQVRDLI